MTICTQQHTAVVDEGDSVGFGQHLADVGDTGAEEGAFHLHLATTNLGESNKNAGGRFVTIPAPLANYEASNDGGVTWKRVIRGIPRDGQWIRVPAARPLRYTAVWRASTEGEIQVYGWEYEDYRGRYDVLWHQRWRLKHIVPFVV